MAAHRWPRALSLSRTTGGEAGRLHTRLRRGAATWDEPDLDLQKTEKQAPSCRVAACFGGVSRRAPTSLGQQRPCRLEITGGVALGKLLVDAGQQRAGLRTRAVAVRHTGKTRRRA